MTDYAIHRLILFLARNFGVHRDAWLGNLRAIRLSSSLNHPGNVMNLQMDAHKDYDKLSWGIEANEHDGTVRVNLNKKPSCC